MLCAQVERERLRVQVSDALQRGLSVRAISQELGISFDKARKTARRILEELRKSRVDNVESMVAQEVDRLDALMAAHWQPAMVGDPDSSKVVLRTIDARARLLGLNAETRTKLTIDHQVSITESPEFVQVAQVMLAAVKDQPELRALVASRLRELAPARENTTIEGEFAVTDEEDDDE